MPRDNITSTKPGAISKVIGGEIATVIVDSQKTA
jgi:hypothetical protein